MSENIAFIQKNGEFTIEFENGKIKRGAPAQSYALHNLLCYGRLNRNLTNSPTKRMGWSGSSAYIREFFSTSWNYYIESNMTESNLNLLINEFNRACTRDFNQGFVDKKVKIVKVTKLARNILKILLSTDEVQSNITIEL
jgi:hypothetical protein